MHNYNAKIDKNFTFIYFNFPVISDRDFLDIMYYSI